MTYLTLVIALAISAIGLFIYTRWQNARVNARLQARRERYRQRQERWDETVGTRQPAGSSGDGAH